MNIKVAAFTVSEKSSNTQVSFNAHAGVSSETTDV